MELRDTPDEAAFRAELRAWLTDNNPGLVGHTDLDAQKAWSRTIFDAGYAGLMWAKEYGGGGDSYSHQAILLEEWARAEAPSHLGVIGLGMAGPTIIAHGTDEQKQRYLANILSGEEVWCQGFSEPGAGSDLAAVRTSAELRDGHFVVNGQKVWSSYAHIADWCILVTRSDPDSQKHAGLTYLLVDMHSPGIEVRPLRHITGDADFNEIFFENVAVPVDNVLDEIGNGWAVAMTTLLHERGTLGFTLTGGLEVLVNKLIALTKERGVEDSRLRDMVAREWVELQALKLTNYRSLTKLVETGIPGPEGSVSKLHWSEQMQRLSKLAVEIQEGEPDEFWRHTQLRTRGNTIEAGTSEILRNIIAERVLGLPRSR